MVQHGALPSLIAPGWPALLGGGAALFEAGAQSHASLRDFGAHIAAGIDSTTAPTAGGALSINGKSLGAYDYTIFGGNKVVSSFAEGDWFTTTPDSVSAIVVVKGNLTINAGQVLKPAHRKLFTFIYVTGDVVLNGEISMSSRGANHGASGSNITAQDILIASGKFSGITDPTVPAVGGIGGAARSGASLAGNPGGDGTFGGTAAGGSGSTSNNAAAVSGAGANGSSFSGGPGGGAAAGAVTATAGTASGGKGGDAAGGTSAGAGAGNPGGDGGGTVGSDGAGGTLIIICLGQLSGSGSLTSAGAVGGAPNNGGGSSGGGSITVLSGNYTGNISMSALGGAAVGIFRLGGAGGYGSVRHMSLSSSGYDSDAAAYFGAFSTAASDARKSALNDLFLKLKVYGVLDQMEMAYLLGAHAADAAWINLVDPGSFDITPINSPTVTMDDGVNGDGSSSYLSTGYVPSADAVKLQQNSGHVALWNLTNTDENGRKDYGCREAASGAATIGLQTRESGSAIFSLNNNGGAFVSNAVATGFFVTLRAGAAAADLKLHKDDLLLGVGTSSTDHISSGLPSRELLIGARNTGGVIDNYTTRKYRFFSIGALLRAGQAVELRSVIVDYYTAIGAP